MLSSLAKVKKADSWFQFERYNYKVYEARFYLYIIVAGRVQEHCKIYFAETNSQNLSM